MPVDNNKKIECAICKKWEGHIIVGHLKKAHPKVDAFAYIMKYSAPIASAHGHLLLRATARKELVLERATSKKKVSDIFELEPWDGSDTSPRKFVGKDVKVFDEPHATTPIVDPDYVFPEEVLRRALMATTLRRRNNLWLHGYSGTGKTEFALQLCARLNRGCLRLNGDANISRRQLIGDKVVHNGEMSFEYGIVPICMMQGLTLIIDEIDNLSPAVLAILRPVLENHPSLVILENGSEVIHAHPDFRVIATANTAGGGDESGLFLTSRALSVADRQRFSIWSEVKYLPPKIETKMIKKKFPDLEPVEVKRFYQVVKNIRARHMKRELEESFSHREFINWVEKFTLTGDAMEAAQMCFLDRYQNEAVQLAVSELVKAAWDEHSTPDEVEEEPKP